MEENKELVNEIIERHRARREFHRAEKAMTLRIKCTCRRMCRNLLCEGKKCEHGLCKLDAAEATLLYDVINRKAGGEHPLAFEAKGFCLPFFQARDAVKKPRLEHERALEKLAEKLRVWDWCEGVDGVGRLALSQIVGEAGEVSRFGNPAKLWKRMGLAVIDGKSQRRVADAEKAEEQGYNPLRRSTMYVVGDCIIKKQGVYRDLYLAKKEFYAAKFPDHSKVHLHRMAQRFMEKRFLKHLWRVWNGKAAVGADDAAVEEPALVGVA